VTAPWNAAPSPVPTVAPAPMSPAAPTAVPAPLGTRIGAFLLDYVVYLLAASPLVVGSALTASDAASGSGSSGAGAGLLVAGYVLVLAVAVFQLWSEGSRGGTIGKRALRLRVVLVGTGSYIGFGRAMLRGIVRGLPLVVLTPLFMDQRRGLHDLAVGSIVTTSDAVSQLQAAGPHRRAAGLASAPSPFAGTSTSAGPAAPPPPPAGTDPAPVPTGSRPAPPPPPAGFYGTPTGAVPVVRPGAGSVPAAPLPPVPPAPPAPSAAPAVAVPGVPAPAAPLPPVPAPPALEALPRGWDAPPPPPPVAQVPAVPDLPPAPDVPTVPPAPDVPPVPPTPDVPEVPVVPDVPSVPAATASFPSAPAGRPAESSVPVTTTGGVTPVLPPPPSEESASRRAAAPAPVPPVAGLDDAGSDDPGLHDPVLDDSVLDDDFDDSTRIAPVRRLAGRPPRAVLHLSDGRTVPVASTILVGRKPVRTPLVDAEALLQVADPGRSLSKSHVLIGVDDDGVWVADQQSTNGTVITLPDGQQIICGAQQVVRLPEGAVISAGDLTIRAEFEPGEQPA